MDALSKTKTRFWAKVRKDDDGCWRWTGATDKKAKQEYGIFRLSRPRRVVSAHRYAYQLANGRPAGKYVFRTCKDSLCVRPAHLVATERQKRLPRKPFFWSTKPTHCQRGHEWTEANTLRESHGRRLCRECARLRRMTPEHREKSRVKMAKWRSRHREAVNANARKRRVSRKEWVDAFKRRHACGRCGESDPTCLDFHHRDPAAKDINVGIALAHWSLKRIEAEVAKTDVLCSNCHRKLHAAERQDPAPVGRLTVRP